LYSREITEPPAQLIINGRPVFGTFSGITKQLDIKGVSAPFAGFSLLPIFTRLRIRARLLYLFSFGDYLGSIEIFDNKILNMADIILWNKKTNKKYEYHKFFGVRQKFVPKNLEKAICFTPSKKFHVRLGWDQKKDRFSIVVELKSHRETPTLTLSFLSHFSDDESNQLISVKPAPTMRRCSATWYVSSNFCGNLGLVDKNNHVKDFIQGSNGTSLLFVNRAYYKTITKGENISAAGKINDKSVTLRLSTTSLDAVDTNKYNDNVLFINGKLFTMPPVDITHPFGINEEWVIQDLENMIDLTFKPSSISSKNLNLIAIRTEYNTIFGFINGIILNQDGEKLVLKEFPAIVKKSMIRL